MCLLWHYLVICPFWSEHTLNWSTAGWGAHGRPMSTPSLPLVPRCGALGGREVGGATGAWRPGRRALGLMASGATCVQRLDDSRDSAIHTKYRILLRSSSMREPRYPLPRVVCVWWNDDDPPTRPIGTGATGARCFVVRFLGAFRAGVRCSLERAAAGRPPPVRGARRRAGLPGPPERGEGRRRRRARARALRPPSVSCNVFAGRSEVRQWSFRRFTYGNLVTTSPSSKW